MATFIPEDSAVEMTPVAAPTSTAEIAALVGGRKALHCKRPSDGSEWWFSAYHFHFKKAAVNARANRLCGNLGRKLQFYGPVLVLSEAEAKTVTRTRKTYGEV